MNKHFIAALALGFAASGLASCSQEAEQTVEAAPEGFPGISVTDARLVLPAVKGNPGALYFEIAYDDPDADRPATISSAYVEGAESAMLHSSREMAGTMYMEEVMQMAVESGSSVTFEPGAFHVMVMNISDTLAPGDTTEGTLTFVGGDKTSFAVEVRAPGDADIRDDGATG